ncbi:helix-turn-helix domain-containing protein [Acinetobacter lactucae]|uniref:helix-turn-helix domain-containing protein n=1 Tax=Acinetobacter lactucae TaxID=1785128 RepID=UPI0039F71DAB
MLERQFDTEAGFFAVETYKTMKKFGLDVAYIFSKLDKFVPVTSPEFRNNGEIHKYLWDIAEESSGDKLIGLHIGENMPVLRGHIVEYIFISSSSFSEALEKVIGYFPLISDLITAELQVKECAEIIVQFKLPIRHFSEFSLSQVVAFLKYITNGKFRLNELRLPYALNADEAEYLRVFDCPVIFDSIDMAMVFDSDILVWKSPSAEPHLLAAHEILAERFLADLAKHDLIFRIQNELDKHLPLEIPDRNNICERLNKDPQKLKVELASIGTNFSEIIDNYQKNLACGLLRQRDMSIEQIAYMTGFSEPSAFHRAFKRWTGLTPRQYSQKWG